MPMRIGLLIALIGLVGGGRRLLAAGPPVPDDIVVHRDLAYRQGSGRHWRLDLATKRDRGGRPRPGIVVIHGGGWIEGDRSSFASREHGVPGNIVDFAALGFVAATINYRLAGEAPFPAALEDCKNAVRWMRAHAGEYHLDPDRIGAYGNSAGGHLAMLLGMVGPEAHLEGDGPYQDRSSLVQAVVSDSGPIDLVDQYRRGALREVCTRFLGGPPEGDRAASYRLASPIEQINPRTPPVLLIYGVDDVQVPVETADRFVLALGRAGLRDVSYHRLAGVDHCPYSLARRQPAARRRCLLHPHPNARPARRPAGPAMRGFRPGRSGRVAGLGPDRLGKARPTPIGPAAPAPENCPPMAPRIIWVDPPGRIIGVDRPVVRARRPAPRERGVGVIPGAGHRDMAINRKQLLRYTGAATLGAAIGAVVRGLLAADSIPPTTTPTIPLPRPQAAPPAPPRDVVGHESFSQSGEDLIVAFMAYSLGISKVSYLDVGANDPVQLSNTYYFYKKGARGVLVEPNVALCQRLREQRPGDTVLEAGIGVTAAKEADYYIMTYDGLNTFSREEAEHQEKTSGGRVKIRQVIKMPMLDINRVMEQYFQEGAPTFLSVDTEGLDLAILRSIDFRRFRPPIICAETLVSNTRETRPEIPEFMAKHGYLARGSSFVNTIFVDSKRL